MKAFLYYYAHAFINGIKKLFKTWVAVFLLVCFGFGIAVGIGASVLEEKLTPEYSESEIVEEEVPDMTEQEKAELAKEIVPLAEMAGLFIPLLFMLIYFYNGDKSGSDIFNLSDVNFLFVAPLRPQSVLLFKTVLKMGAIMASALYLLFQFPNLIASGVPVLALIILTAIFILCVILGLLTSVCTYTVVATKPSRKKAILPITVFIILAFAAVLYLTKAIIGVGWYEAAKLCFASKYCKFIPIIGWISAMAGFAVRGAYLKCAGMFLLLVAGASLIIYLFWKMKADFYEDALNKAAARQEQLNAAAEGRQARKKERKRKFKESEIGRGYGANAFFFREAYTRRRSGFFGVLSKRAITYTLTAAVVAAFVKFVVGSTAFAAVPIILLVFHFFANFASPIATETQKSYLFLIPESKYKKVFYLLLSGVTATAIDLVPAFLVSAVLIGTVPISELAVWAAVFVTFDFFSSTTGLAIDMILPHNLAAVLKMMFCIYLRIFVALPLLILLIIGAATNTIVVYAILTATVNVVAGVGCFALGTALLRQ